MLVAMVEMVLVPTLTALLHLVGVAEVVATEYSVLVVELVEWVEMLHKRQVSVV
jgi:hypothetical protein